MYRILYCFILLLSALPISNAEPIVVTTTAIISDLAQQIGGEHIQVSTLVGLGEDPHSYAPTPGELTKISKAQLLLLSGKGLEDPFIEQIQATLSPETLLLEVGRKVPSCTLQKPPEVFVCCPNHVVSTLDPHWWHSVKAMQRAAREVKKALITSAPAYREHYEENYEVYIKELKFLDKWIKNRISTIPKKQRLLTTTHAAFAYFCRDYGFKAIPASEISEATDPHAENVEKRHVVFSPPLISDNLTEDFPSYIQMMRYNLNTICNTLGKAED